MSRTPLFSPWNTQFYRLVGPAYPAEGTLVTRQVTKSAFELEWDAQLAAGRPVRLTGRSWSGTGAVRRVEVSTDGGTTWRLARTDHPGSPRGWRRWHHVWRPPAPGAYMLRARAYDANGVVQPPVSPHNTQGYLFGAVVGHPVRVAG